MQSRRVLRAGGHFDCPPNSPKRSSMRLKRSLARLGDAFRLFAEDGSKNDLRRIVPRQFDPGIEHGTHGQLGRRAHREIQRQLRGEEMLRTHGIPFDRGLANLESSNRFPSNTLPQVAIE